MGYVLALLWLVLFVYCLVDVVRADEAHHREVNHRFANELAGLRQNGVAPCRRHVVRGPDWKQAA